MLAEGSLWISHPDLAAVLQDVLSQGQSFRFRADGLSMLPFIRPGDLLTVRSLDGKAPGVGDVVLYQVTGERLAAHRVVSGVGEAFGSAILLSAQRRFYPRRPKKSSLDSATCKPDLLGWIRAAKQRPGQPIATRWNQEHTASSASIDQGGPLHVRGDRLWAPLELVHRKQVLGQVVAIERDGRPHHLTRTSHRLLALAWIGLRPFVRSARSRLGMVKRCAAGVRQARGGSAVR